MKRELNPIIFGTAQSNDDLSKLGRSIGAFDQGENPTLSLPAEAKEELKALRLDLAHIQKESSKELGRAQQQSQAFADEVTSLFENMSERINAIESHVRESHSEQAEQVQMNKKIEDLLERHNQIVRNFENKLIHLSRILTEQEIQILNSKSALEEAHRELARLRGL